jgi:hypothetical protein
MCETSGPHSVRKMLWNSTSSFERIKFLVVYVNPSMYDQLYSYLYEFLYA